MAGVHFYNNTKEAEGDLVKVALYTGVDLICDLGPLEMMQIGASIGPVGAVVGFIAGTFWTGTEFFGEKILGYDIRSEMKAGVGSVYDKVVPPKTIGDKYCSKLNSTQINDYGGIYV